MRCGRLWDVSYRIDDELDLAAASLNATFAGCGSVGLVENQRDARPTYPKVRQ